MISFEFGQSLFHQGEFQRAAEVLEQFCAHADKHSAEYREAVFKRLRIYTEMDEAIKRLELEKEIQITLKNLNAKGAATFYYVQGYNSYTEQHYENAFELFEKALQHAVAAEDQCRYTLAQALFGCIISSVALNKNASAISQKMEKLELLSAELDRADLQVSVLSLKSTIALQNDEYQKAIDLAWQSYDKVKLVKNNFLSLSAIAKIGNIYLRLGDQEKARFYIQLAERSVDNSNYKLLGLIIARLKEQLKQEPLSDYDLILNEQNHVLFEKHKGPIELKNQFLLVDLLRLLMQNPGVPFSKENLAEKLWKQKYDPAMHDNTIYVTIKRIRSLIEPNPHHSKYVLRSRQGYLLNQDLKILIQTKEPLT
jgi:DNA-binding winged helix-turn-helix (wHTH) protein